MNYKSWDDEGLRRVLIADPDDTAAICEAAERFAKQGEIVEVDDIRTRFEVGVMCPECEHEWREEINTADL
jgi:hypothetical protein